MTQGAQQASHIEVIGAFLDAQKLQLGDMVEALLFFVGDSLSQATDMQYDEAVFNSVCKDLKNAYLICCDQQPETSAIITTH